MDRDPDGYWWVMGLMLGVVIILALMLVDARDQIIDQQLVINSLRVEKHGQKSKEQAWTCSRISEDAKRGGLVKWCVSKSGA